MTLNEALIRQAFIIHLIVKDEKSELSKDLKVKIMNMRVVLNKLRKDFDKACEDKIEELQTEELTKLLQIENNPAFAAIEQLYPYAGEDAFLKGLHIGNHADELALLTRRPASFSTALPVLSKLPVRR